MLNVGLTGGIACGKSTVARMFLKHGAHLIDFDRLAHEVQEPGKPAWLEIINLFGREIICSDKKIDRVKLGNIVFKNKKKLTRLNRIVHPPVYQEWRKSVEKICKKENHAIILSDIPLLFEGKKQHLFDLTMLVIIDPEEQVRRLMARNGLSREEAQQRLKSQMPINEKIILADIVIDNKGSISQTEKKVEKIWQELLRVEKQKNKSNDICGIDQSIGNGGRK